jgi:hypothetical protein
VTKRDGSCQAGEILNARRLTLERQFFPDDFDSLLAEAQGEVINGFASLKDHHQQQEGQA